MSKVLLLFILVFFYFVPVFSNSDEINIIKRSEWWAEEKYRYRDSSYWIDILRRWSEAPVKELTEEQKKVKNDRATKVNSINSYLINIFPENNSLVQTIKDEKWHSLAWNIQKTKYVRAIVVHHTDSEYDTSEIWIKAIYKYHALNRAWWDIWYNYIVWYDWEIYEWRAWWDYTVWAHAVWNNRSTVSISVMWNYSKKSISESQYKSLDKLIKHLTTKYWIDLSKNYNYHRECYWDECKIWVNSYTDSTLIWHRDTWVTSCPWDELEKQIQTLREENLAYTKWLKPIANTQIDKITKTIKIWKKAINKLTLSINNISERKKLLLLAKVEEKLDNLTFEDEKYYLYYQIKEIIVSNFKVKDYFSAKNVSEISFDKKNKIRVKLSYPLNDYINISDWEKSYEIKKDWKKLLLNWENKEIIHIKSVENDYLEITSWDRIPSWDKNNEYNDNKFRWDIIVYIKDDKLVVVNRLFLHDYLKWLWEISDYENTEKIKTIIIAARTYARWYMTEDNKFPTEFYQASDDPEVFQKYLWYGLEMRSPKVNKIVNETTDRVITYEWKIIKPWYFSSSNWSTISFNKFCEYSSWIPDCSNPNGYPFLLWVRDPGGIWNEKWWHWVWIAWTWVKYFAERWWNSEMIIKYFLNWVEIVNY